MGASRNSKLSSQQPDRVAGGIYAGTPSENYGRYSFQSDYAPSRQSDYLGVARRYQAPSTSPAEEEITTQEAAPAPALASAPKKENPLEALLKKSKEKKKTRQQMLDERLAQRKAEQEQKAQLLRERTPFKNFGKKP
jgi:hypothetical protein